MKSNFIKKHSAVYVIILLVLIYAMPAYSQDDDIQYAKRLSSAFVKVSEMLTPAVVSIEATKEVQDTRQGRRRELEDLLPFFQQPEDFRATGLGSGVIIDEEGYILTNNHVVEGAIELIVRLNDRRQYEAELVGADPQTDVAVIKITGENLPFAKLGNSDDVRVGEWVLAVGTPFGESLTSTVTAGIVSAVGRNLGIINQNQRYRIENFIQTDAAINPGNSGGPLINLNGEVIGINTAIVSSTGRYQGYGFAIPINLVANIAEDLRRYGQVRRGIIGVSIRDIGINAFEEPNNPRSRRLSLQEDMENHNVTSPDGVLILDFAFEDSPGKEAGLERGDVIVKIDDKPIKRSNELQTRISGSDPGDKVKFTVMRDGRMRDFWVTLGAIPEEQQPVIAADVNIPEIGVEVREAERTESESRFSRRNTVQGVQVVRVLRGSEAENKGIEIGDFIYKIDKMDINSVEDFQRAINRIRNREQVVFYIRNDRGAHLVTMNLNRR